MSSSAIIGLLNFIFLNRRVFLVIPSACVVLALAVKLLAPQQYVAVSVLMPETTAPRQTDLAGIATRLGLGSPAGESTEFYARVLESRELLTRAVLTEYSLPAGNRSNATNVNLIRAFEVDRATEAEAIRAAGEELRERLSVQVDPIAGLLTLSVRAASPELATAVNARILELLDDFNVERRQSRAASERQFVEARMHDAQTELHGAEDELAAFLEQNRRYEDSPPLRFEAGRLQRRVELRQAVYTALAQAYEQARTEEVRNTPVITVVDSPLGSARPAGPGLIGTIVLALILGLLIAIGVGGVRYLVDKERAAQSQLYRTFASVGRPRRVGG